MKAAERIGERSAPQHNYYFDLPAATAATTAASSTTATASATISSAASASTTTARTAAAFARTCLIDPDVATLEFGVVEFLDRPCSVVRVSHFDESESARLSRELVDYHHGAIDFAGLSEQTFQVFVGD
jgi:hypothetical protein